MHVARILIVIIGLLSASVGRAAQGPASHRPGLAACPGYQVVHGWPILPDGEVLGAVAGVGVDSHGNVYAFHRPGRSWPASDVLNLTPLARPAITVFDGRTGAVRARWGANQFAMPHGLTIDANDNVWLTDVALQQVYKYSADGQLLMTLGERGVAGDDAGHFNRPTAVAVAPDGSFYVSDGYRNSRVAKYSAQGEFQFQWGTFGAGPGQFEIPHWVVLDADGHVYVADRQNDRVQVFDGSGHYLRQWAGKELGRPYGLAIDRRGRVYVADGGPQPDEPPDRSAWSVLDSDGVPIARIGRFGNYDGEFQMAHSIAVDRAGSVYVGDITGARIQKFVRSPFTRDCRDVAR